MVHFEAYRDDKGLEQGPSDLASRTLLSLFEGGRNVSTSLENPSPKIAPKVDWGQSAFSHHLTRSPDCIDIGLPLPSERLKPFDSGLGRKLVRPHSLFYPFLEHMHVRKGSEGTDPFSFGGGGTGGHSFPCHSNAVRPTWTSLQEISALGIHLVQL